MRNAGFDRAARGQKRAARLLKNYEAARMRYDKSDYDGSQGAGDGE